MTKEILLSNDGDFIIGADGDIATIDSSNIMVEAQDICVLLERTFANTEKETGLIGADLTKFTGNPISDNLISTIENIIEKTILLNTNIVNIKFVKTKIINNTLLMAIEISDDDNNAMILLSASPSRIYATSFN